MISYDRLLEHTQVKFALSKHFKHEIAGSSLLGFLWSEKYFYKAIVETVGTATTS